jgi:hypothetical protein
MQRDRIFSVIGRRLNGDRVVITKDTNHETAEQIVGVMKGGSTFEDLFIEPEGDAETANIGCGFSACDGSAPAASCDRNGTLMK